MRNNAILMLLGFAAAAQPKFEVASVKVSKPGTPVSSSRTHGGITMLGVPLIGPIQYAYRLERYRMAGAPPWLESERYDIVAKTSENSSDVQLRVMLRALLEDRFALKYHVESKEMPVYALELAKDGPKFTVEKREPREDDNQVRGGGPGRIGGFGVVASYLAEVLCDYADRPVIDRTGIDGRFNFRLIWTPEPSDSGSNEPPSKERRRVPDPNGPPISVALRDQLGLRLVPAKAPVEMFVIDSVAKVPTGN